MLVITYPNDRNSSGKLNLYLLPAVMLAFLINRKNYDGFDTF